MSRSRPPQRRVAPGLYLAGHWTTPAAGVPWVMLSGFNTANAVLLELAKQGSADIPGQARPEVSR
jgi:phytoene dehydrogenase-like protein